MRDVRPCALCEVCPRGEGQLPGREAGVGLT